MPHYLVLDITLSIKYSQTYASRRTCRSQWARVALSEMALSVPQNIPLSQLKQKVKGFLQKSTINLYILRIQYRTTGMGHLHFPIRLIHSCCTLLYLARFQLDFDEFGACIRQRSRFIVVLPLRLYVLLIIVHEKPACSNLTLFTAVF